jgi:hypothetical protein
LMSPLDMEVKALTRGWNVFVIAVRSFATRKANFSLCSPKAFGADSPNIRSIKNIRTVAMPMPMSPKISVTIAPASIEAKMLTRLLQMTIALTVSFWFFKRVRRSFARWSPSRALSLIEARLMEMNAISDPEKIPERLTNMAMVIIPMMRIKKILNINIKE